MDVRIGVVNNPKEILVEVGEDVDRAELKARIDKALGDDQAEQVLWFTDRRGREVVVPAAKVAYVELGSPASGRYIGFGAT